MLIVWLIQLENFIHYLGNVTSVRTSGYFIRDGKNLRSSVYQYFKFSNEETMFLRHDLIYPDTCLLPSLGWIPIRQTRLQFSQYSMLSSTTLSCRKCSYIRWECLQFGWKDGMFAKVLIMQPWGFEFGSLALKTQWHTSATSPLR